MRWQTGDRIAIVVAAMDSGGAERAALNLAEHFAASSIPVDLVLVRKRGALLSQVPPAVRIIDLKAKRAATSVMPLRKYLLQEAPNAILAINFEVNLAAALACRLLCRARKPRLVLSVHSAPSLYFGSAPGITSAMTCAASKWLYPRANEVVAVSQGVATELRQMGWSTAAKISVIYNPVIRPDFEIRAEANADHPWLNDRSVPVIVSVGRLTRAKNYPLLLRAIADVASSRPVRLIVVGEGELREQLEAEASNLGISAQVSFVGYQENPYPFMRHASVFVLSSDWEGMSIVLAEAMATGTSIVATDCPHGPSEILEGGKWGRLVPTGDREALAQAIRSAIDDPKILGGAVERARGFTVQAAADRYLSLMYD